MNDTVENVATTRIYTNYENQHFIWDLRSENTGTLHDVIYEEAKDFTHDIDANIVKKIAELGNHKQTQIFSNRQRYYKFAEDLIKLRAYCIEQDMDQDYNTDGLQTKEYIIEKLKDLFYGGLNEELENTVGQPLDDVDPEVCVGTLEEFESAIESVLAIVRHNPKRFNWSDRSGINFEWNGNYNFGLQEEVDNLIKCIVNTFGYDNGYTYEYTGNNDGRVTSHSREARSFNLKNKNITYSARELFNKYNQVREMFIKYNPEGIKVLETTFAQQTISETDSA